MVLELKVIGGQSVPILETVSIHLRNRQFPLWKRTVPTMETNSSHYGNELFPLWKLTFTELSMTITAMR